MQPVDRSAHSPRTKGASWRYSQEIFRSEAVEAYTTRQAGEPWDAKHPLEGLIVIALTLAAGAALAFIALGGR